MRLTVSGREAALFPAAGGNDIAYVIGGIERAEEIARLWQGKTHLAFLACEDWNSALSPWAAPACFRGGEDFSGGADAFLSNLTSEILPACEQALNISAAARALIGVSLGGLFAVYALYKTDAFSKVGSVSGSLWFDGFADYMQSHALCRRPDRLYLSLGDREERTRNPRLARVGDDTRAAREFFAAQGISATLEMNPGNHFVDGEARLIKALTWLYA